MRGAFCGCEAPLPPSAYGPAKALRCADVLAVLARLPQARADQLRRLQITAQTRGAVRPGGAHCAQRNRRPSELRLPDLDHRATPRGRPYPVSVIERRGPRDGCQLVARALKPSDAATVEGPGAQKFPSKTQEEPMH